MANRSFVLAAAQMTSRDDLEENLTTCRRLAAEAASKDAKLLVFPECFAFLSRREEDKRAVAEVIGPDAPGPVQRMLREIAREHEMWIIGGGMAERKPGDSAEAQRVYNTAVAVSPSGELAATYRKMHLFDIDIPGGATLKESDSTYGGETLRVVPTELAHIGMSICYDLRFPELYRKLAADGAQVLVVPAAFTAHTGAAHWHVLMRARAIENQCYVVAAAQAGRHNDKRESYGHTLVVDPWGGVAAELAEGTGVVTATVDLDFLDKTRTQMPCLQHRVLR